MIPKTHREGPPSEEGQLLVSSFYLFAPITLGALASTRSALELFGRESGIRGLVLLAEEGINATVCGAPESVREFVRHAASVLNHPSYRTKESWSSTQVFRRFRVQVREEIVTFATNPQGAEPQKPEPYVPDQDAHGTHLSPAQWAEWLRSGRECTLLDTRNWYESSLGTFRGAVTPDIQNFTELKGFLAASELPRDKPLLMFCTGGIRCEKALPELYRAGFKEVYQLDGGILNYFSSVAAPEAELFMGECFVFDHRVAVDTRLAPSTRYRLCPHCGNPASEEVCCVECATTVLLCRHCREQPARMTCSKNCAYHRARRMSRDRRAQESCDNRMHRPCSPQRADAIPVGSEVEK